MNRSLKTILDNYNADTLISIGVETGVMTRGGSKPKKALVVSQLASKLGTAKRVKASLADLDDLAKSVLARLQMFGGTVVTTRFQRDLVRAKLTTEEPQPMRVYGGYGPASESGDPYKADSTLFDDVIARLTLHGFVFTEELTDGYGGYNYKFQFNAGATLFIPEEIAAHLPPPDPSPTADKSWSPATLVQGDPALYLRDLYLYWDFVCRQPLGLTQQGYVRKNSLKALNRLLLQPDPRLAGISKESESPRLYLLRQQLELLDLIDMIGSELLATGLERVPPFWLAAPETQIGRLVHAWIRSEDDPLPDTTMNHYAQWPHARTVLVTVLAQLRIGVWTEVDQILDRLYAREETFLFSERSQAVNYFRRYYGSYGTNLAAERIDEQERQFVVRAGAVPLVQLGLVELGHTGEAEGDWYALRLTERGQRILAAVSAEASTQGTSGKLTANEPPVVAHHPLGDGGQVIVQPNFHILAMGPVSMATLARLDDCADREKADVSVFEYQLTRESVYRAQQVGTSAAEIAAFLAEVSGVPLPQNIVRSLEEWGARHQRITFRLGATLLQTLDEKSLADLMDSPALKGSLQPTPVAEIAIVNHSRRQTINDALLKQNIFPAHDDGKPESANGGVRIHEDGAVQPIHALPSLQLAGRLNRFAEEDGHGGWRITSASIGQAGGDRAKVNALLKEMATLYRGELSPELIEQVKQWGGYYGGATVNTLTLIEFTDVKTLRELRKNKRLKALLTPFQAGDRALATLSADDLPAIKELLQERGIAVRSGIRK